MRCCKAEQYDNWCQNESPNYTDDEGNKYCVFHAPKGKKNVDDVGDFLKNVFNKKIINRINLAKERGTVCDLRGTIFEGPISFSNYTDRNSLPEMRFDYAQFDVVDFNKAKLNYRVYFIGASFNGEADFSNTEFAKEVYFHHSVFHDRLLFKENTFSKDADFSFCSFKKAYFRQFTFSAKANFYKAHFEYAEFNHVQFGQGGKFDFKFTTYKNEIMFKDCHFHGNADYSNLKFWSVSFDKCVFNGELDFRHSEVKVAAHFSNAIFNRSANFSNASFRDAFFPGAFFKDWCLFNAFEAENAYFPSAIFERTKFHDSMFKKVDFRGVQFREMITFSHNIFEEHADFLKANFKEAVFQGDTFHGKVNFEAVIIENEVRFESVNLEKAIFRDSFIKKMSFVNINWYRKGEGLLDLDNRNVLFDEVEVLEKTRSLLHEFGWLKRQLLKVKLWLFPVYVEDFSKVNVLYNTLKQKFKQEHNEAEASNWHYCEKEMQRRTTSIRKSGFMWIVYNLYRFSSGYSEAPLRAFMFLLFLLVLYGLGLILSGFVPLNDKAYVADLTRSGYSAIGDYFIEAAKYASFQKDYYFKPVNVAGETVKLVGKIAIPIQAALFAMAIRNRFRR